MLNNIRNDEDDNSSKDTLIKRRRNHLWINSAITPELLMQFQNALLDVQEYEHYIEQSWAPITVHLHSPGGDLLAGLAIYDLLKSYSGEVTTIVEGYAASAASIILMAGKERYIRPSGFILIHALSTGMWGKHQEIIDTVKMLNLAAERMRNIYQVASNQSEATVKTWLEHETWFDATEAIKLNLAQLMTSHT